MQTICFQSEIFNSPLLTKLQDAFFLMYQNVVSILFLLILEIT